MPQVAREARAAVAAHFYELSSKSAATAKPTFVAPVITPKGSVSTEMVLYKGQRLKVPADAGIWYIRWEEGHQPKWRRCESMSDAIQQQVRKRIELQAVSVGLTSRQPTRPGSG